MYPDDYSHPDEIDHLVEKECSWVNSCVKLFMIAIIAAVIYWLLSIPSVECYFCHHIPRYGHRVFAKGLILFFFVLLAVTLLYRPI